MATRTRSDLYQMLPADGYIRLLTIKTYPRIDRSRIHCTLSTHSFEALPPYAALSYTWSGEPVDAPITVDGVDIHVTTSCFDALKTFRDFWFDALIDPSHNAASQQFYNFQRKGIRTLWVDQICINQQDDEERAHQVLLMRNIYSRADGVWAFVNPRTMPTTDLEGRGSHKAYEGFTGARSPEQRTLELVRQIHGLRDDVIDEDNEFWSSSNDAGAWLGLMNLLKARYFERRWILQEISVNSDTFLYYHKRLINMRALEIVDRVINQSIFDMRRTFRWPMSVQMSVAFSRFTDSGGALSVSRQLWSLRPASDPQLAHMMFAMTASGHLKTDRLEDAIFSLQSFAPADAGLPPPVYGTPWQQLCFQYAAMFMKLGFAAQILQLGGTAWHRTPGLPSWVPELTNLGRYQSITAFASRTANLNASRFLDPSELPTLIKPPDVSGCLRVRVHLASAIDLYGEYDWEKNFLPHALRFVHPVKHRLVHTPCREIQAMLEEMKSNSPKQIHKQAQRYAHQMAGLKVALHTLVICALKEQAYDAASLPFLWHYLQMEKLKKSHKVAITASGLLGFVAHNTEAGDQVALVPGCWLPLIVRKIEADTYRMIGDGFFLGLNGMSDFEKEEECQYIHKAYRTPRDKKCERSLGTPELEDEDLVEIILK